MATPDLSTLTSSAQIFSSNYTLPQIRAIHKSLHVEIDEKASRLRTQVGNSYRDLLGTADTIVQMRRDNDTVQTVLGRMGGRCGRGVVGSKISGLGNFERGLRERSGADVGVVARARLLEACALVVGRMLSGSSYSSGGGSQDLSRGDRVVIASKVLVLSRLLVKSLGEEEQQQQHQRQKLDEDVAYAVEIAEKSLGKLKQRLFRDIDHLLERAGDSVKQQDVLKALCAHSLANSSGARDVLRHFLTVRAKAMALAFEVDDNERQRSAADVLKSLSLYTNTLLDVQALVPFKLADALSDLKRNPLLADPALKRLEGLRLDVYERWCGDYIQFFTPFIRHDDVDGQTARDMLFGWAKTEGEVLVGGLRKTMDRMIEFKSIIELRTSVLQLWIREGGKARGFDPSEMLDELRGTINGHMLHVLEAKVSKLHLVGSEVSATLGSWQDGVTDRPIDLWNVRDFDADLVNGADHFLQDLVARLHGRNDSVSRVVNTFQSWRHVIDEVGEVVEQLKRQRWDNDVDEIEDEETIEERQQLLSRDDPRMLHEKLDASLIQAFRDLDEKLAGLWRSRAEAPNSGRVAMYFLRVLRDVRQGLPAKPDAVRGSGFGLTVVPSLHEKLALAVSAKPVATFTSGEALVQGAVVGRPLWEGSPELPTQPSPRAFRFLRDLSGEMGRAGMDLWSAVAVGVIKRHLGKQLSERWQAALATLLSEETDGEVAKEKLESQPNDSTKDKDDEKEKVEDEDEDKQNQESPDTEKEDDEKKADVEEKSENEDEAKQAEAAAADEKDDLSRQQQRRDLLIQWFFDISFLRCYLDDTLPSNNNDHGGGDELKSLEDKVYEQTGLISDAARQRIAKSAQDYHKKTCLLFGLLA